jgi:hypothetical protein
MAEFDESLFDDGCVVARSEDGHGGWIEHRSYGVSVPGIEGPQSHQWTNVESFRRRRDAEIFLAGMRAGWRHGVALSAKRQALREHLSEMRAAVGDAAAVDVSLHCRSCDSWSRHWMTEDNLNVLARQRDTAGLAPVSRSCPECGEEISSELYVDDVRRRLEDWKSLLPRMTER